VKQKYGNNSLLQKILTKVMSFRDYELAKQKISTCAKQNKKNPKNEVPIDRALFKG
jgi:hypothetical protein